MSYCAEGKILRVVCLIEVLKCHRLDVDQIAEKFDINTRTAYRYLNLIEEAGFVIDKDMEFKYFIFDMPPIVKERVKAILQLS